jgi:hypothetical protein
MENKDKPKARRKIKSLDFSGEDAAVALVGPCVGGPANQIPTLVIKAANQFSDEFIEKASTISVSLEITEFLQRFFYLSQVDSEILARTLGYTTAGQEKAALEQQEEMLEGQEPPEYPDWESEPGDKKFERYVESKVASIQVMKQLYEAESIADVISNLSEESYLQLLQDQEMLEKAMKKIDKETKPVAKQRVRTKVVAQDNKTESVEKSTEDVTSKIVHEVSSEDKPSVVTKHKEKKSMTKEVQVIEQTTEVEVIAKAQYDEIQKAMQVQAEQLQKALEQVELFKQEKLEAIAKSRNAAIKDALKDDAKAEVIAKSLRSDLDDTEFQAVVKALADITVQLEKSALFQEQGASVEVEADVNESPVAKALKARLSKQQ